MSVTERLPRELDSLERDLLLWVLPKERPGYAEYRKYVESWQVVAAGRRGEGNYILAESGWDVDTESPLPQIFAYGVTEYEEGVLRVSVRERTGGQLEFEIEGMPDRSSVMSLRQIRRWSFSEWLPSQRCPSCRSPVREIGMETTTAQKLVLALCGRDRRIWVHDERSGVNALIPVTSLYNELMLQTGVKDPVIALDPERLFELQGARDETALIRAFSSYNKLRNKIVLAGDLIIVGERKLNWIQRLVGALTREKKRAVERKES
jgi:hypothetical protein